MNFDHVDFRRFNLGSESKIKTTISISATSQLMASRFVKQARFRPINKLIFSIFVWATVICLIGPLTGRDFYRHVSDSLVRNTKIAETNIPLLSISIWDIEPETIQQQVNVIASPQRNYFVRKGQPHRAGKFLSLAK